MKDLRQCVRFNQTANTFLAIAREGVTTSLKPEEARALASSVHWHLV